MIVYSNAFVFSTSLLEVVFRYGVHILSRTNFTLLVMIQYFLAHQTCLYSVLFYIIYKTSFGIAPNSVYFVYTYNKLIFLVLTFFLETGALSIQYHKLKASNIFYFISFSLLISALSLGTSNFYNLIKIKSKIYPLFRYPIIIMYKLYINIYGQGFGILFRSVIFLVCFSNLNQCSVTRSLKNGRF
jgi:hypothetical protein